MVATSRLERTVCSCECGNTASLFAKWREDIAEVPSGTTRYIDFTAGYSTTPWALIGARWKSEEDRALSYLIGWGRGMNKIPDPALASDPELSATKYPFRSFEVQQWHDDRYDAGIDVHLMRLAAGYTIAEFSKVTGVALLTIRRLESGERRGTWEVLEKIARVLGLKSKSSL